MKKTKVLYFYAPWDNNAYEKVREFKEEMKNLRVPYEIIDVETPEGVNASIKYTVRNVPTIIYTRSGKVVARDKGNDAYKRICYNV